MMPSSTAGGNWAAAAAASSGPQPGTAAATSTSCGTGKKAVVVGAGPAGALTAMLLAQQGWKVDVFERLSPLVGEDGSITASIGPRSYNILLSERAATALDMAGADFSDFDVPSLGVSLRHK